MINKWSALAIGAILLATCAACSSQPASSPPSGGAQVASAGPGKCDLDVKKVCEEMRNRPVVDAGTGQTQDATEREQNSVRTDSRVVALQVPNGSMIEVECEINTHHNSVVYAHRQPGPALTPTDIAFIKNAGYCVQ